MTAEPEDGERMTVGGDLLSAGRQGVAESSRSDGPERGL